MLCSVLIPSRARPAHLIGAIASCFGRAANAKDIEVLVRLDNDDLDRNADVYAYAQAMPQEIHIRVGPRGRGYDDLHLMYNQLLDMARGEWVFQFNDDMRIESPAWDECLRNIKIPKPGNDKVCLINPYDTQGRPTTVSPILRRAGLAALGHLSLNAYCDAWVGTIYGDLKCAFDCDGIKVRHMRDQMNDEVVEGQRKGTAWSVFTSAAQKKLRAKDTEVLAGLIGAPS